MSTGQRHASSGAGSLSPSLLDPRKLSRFRSVPFLFGFKLRLSEPVYKPVIDKHTRRGFSLSLYGHQKALSKAKVESRDECGGVRAELPDPHLPGHRRSGAARGGHPGLRVRLHRFHPSEPNANSRPDPEPVGQPGLTLSISRQRTNKRGSVS